MWLFAVFALSIIAFGRMQGVNTLISLIFLLPVDFCGFCAGDTFRQECLLLDDPDLCFYCRD